MNQFIWIGVLLLLIYFFSLTRRTYNFKKQIEKCESPIEERLCRRLYEEGYKPYTQVKCGAYRIDISVVWKMKRYAIECDGAAYHSSKSQKAHDRTKDWYLEKNKWEVLRFTGKEINQELEQCIKVINRKTKLKK